MPVILGHCDGTVSTGLNGEAICSNSWQTVDLESYVATSFDNHLSTHNHDVYQPLSAEDWSELWPLLLLMFVVAVGVRMVREVFNTSPGKV